MAVLIFEGALPMKEPWRSFLQNRMPGTRSPMTKISMPCAILSSVLLQDEGYAKAGNKVRETLQKLPGHGTHLRNQAVVQLSPHTSLQRRYQLHVKEEIKKKQSKA